MKLLAHRAEFETPPRAAFFDLDHTLYDYDAAHQRAMQAVRQKFQRAFRVNAGSFDRSFAAARDEIKRRLGATASAHSRLLYFQGLLENLGMKSDVVATLDSEQTYWRTFMSSATLFPGVEETLLAFRRVAIPIVLVTDLTTRVQFRKIVHFRLDGLIDYVVTSEEAGADKPDARTFDLALAKAGLTKNDRVWMFGDDIVKDAGGARAHLNALVFLRGAPKGGSARGDVDATFTHFTEILPLIERFSEKRHRDAPT